MTPPAALGPNSVVQAVPEHLCCSPPGGRILFHRGTGKLFELDPVGSRVWGLLQDSRRVAEIQQILLSEYDAEAEECGRDLLDLLQDLTAERLITVQPTTGAPGP